MRREIEAGNPLDFVQSIGNGLLVRAQALRCCLLRTIRGKKSMQSLHQHVTLRTFLLQQLAQLLVDEGLEVRALAHAHEKTRNANIVEANDGSLAALSSNIQGDAGVSPRCRHGHRIGARAAQSGPRACSRDTAHDFRDQT